MPARARAIPGPRACSRSASLVAEPEPSGQPEGGVWFALQREFEEEEEVPMADTVRGIEYCYVTVPDAPGEGQRILSALKDGGVNLLAYLGFPLGGGQSQIDLIPEDPELLREAAERAGITLSEAKRAFLVQGGHRVGAVADTTAKLAERTSTSRPQRPPARDRGATG